MASSWSASITSRWKSSSPAPRRVTCCCGGTIVIRLEFARRQARHIKCSAAVARGRRRRAPARVVLQLIGSCRRSLGDLSSSSGRRRGRRLYPLTRRASRRHARRAYRISISRSVTASTRAAPVFIATQYRRCRSTGTSDGLGHRVGGLGEFGKSCRLKARRRALVSGNGGRVIRTSIRSCAKIRTI